MGSKICTTGGWMVCCDDTPHWRKDIYVDVQKTCVNVKILKIVIQIVLYHKISNYFK